MTPIPVSLPAEAIAVLAGRSNARELAEHLTAAYWMHGRNDGTALYLLREAHSDLAKLADAMGYTITPKADVAEVLP